CIASGERTIICCEVSPERFISADCPIQMPLRGALTAVVIPLLRAFSISLPPGLIVSSIMTSGCRPGGWVEFGPGAGGGVAARNCACRKPPGSRVGEGTGDGAGNPRFVLVSNNPG